MLDAYPAVDAKPTGDPSSAVVSLPDSLCVQMSRIRSSVDLSLSVVTRKERLLIVTVRGQVKLPTHKP